MRNAVSEPICIVPLATRCPPNHSTATLEKFSTSITDGNISAISLPVPSETSSNSVLDASNRSRSWPSRTNARMTRTPVICSRSTLLIPSMRSCMRRNSGRIREMIRVTMIASSGTATSSSEDSWTFWLSARTMPPTHMIGADTIMVNVISVSIWTCWTSLVVLVISDGVPNLPTSRAEKSITRLKMAWRTSRPTAIAVLRAEVDRADRADDLDQGDDQHDRRRYG